MLPTWCQIVWHSYSQNKHPTFQRHNIWASSMLGRIIYKWIVGNFFRSSESTARHDISPKNKFFQSHWQLMAEWEMPGKNLFSGEITIYGKYQKIKNSIRNVIYMLTEEHPLKPELLWSLPRFCWNFTYKYFGGMLV